MDWNCTITEERLSDYLDGALLAEEQLAFSAHLADCAACEQRIESVRDLVGKIQELEMIPEPPRMIARILDATVGAHERSWRDWFDWVPLIWQPRFAMGVATVVASLAIVLHAAGVRPTELTAADLNPANLVRAVDRQAHLSYARGVKFVNDLRVVYEIESRLQRQSQPTANGSESRPLAEPSEQPAPATPRQKSQETPGTVFVRSGSDMASLANDPWSEVMSNSSSRSAR